MKLFSRTMSFNIKVSVKIVRHGDIAGNNKNNSPMVAAGFPVQMIILSYSGKISDGCAPVLGCHTAHLALLSCKFSELLKKEKIDC